MKIAVLIPCYNEEQTIRKVVTDFRRELPDADIYVYDNNSTDKTVSEAKEAGAVVRHEYRQGKGNVIRAMFSEIDADVYVLVDGDDTYPAENAHTLIDEITSGRADMATGDRLSHGAYEKENKRAGHNFGNMLVKNLINILFRSDLKDIMSGYRAFNKLFVKNIPILASGFEIETEMTTYALDKNFKISEIPVDYRDRPDGSVSKLNTISDGLRVLRSIFNLFKDYKPFAFFSFFAGIFLILSLFFGFFPIVEYIQIRYIHRVPLALLATGLAILSCLSFVCALILGTMVKHHKEVYELRLVDWKNRQNG